jgi:hypothetical protein
MTVRREEPCSSSAQLAVTQSRCVVLAACSQAGTSRHSGWQPPRFQHT